MQYSVTVTGRDTQSISIVTNNDNNGHVPAQIQDMLVDVLSTVRAIQRQNSKASWKIG
jgi:hypothetical protein